MSQLKVNSIIPTGGLGTGAINTMLSIIRLPGRIATGQVGDEILENIKYKQAESYYKALADVLFDPDASKSIDEAYNYLSSLGYLGGQTGLDVLGGGAEAVREPSERPYTGEAGRRALEGDNLQSQLDSALESFTPSNIPIVPPATAVTPESALSETVLPNPDDREIARRLVTGRGGIGSLA